MYRCFGSSKSVFGQTDFHQAQKHRAALGPLFSRRATLKLEQQLQRHVDNLISRLLTYETTRKAADLHLALRSVTLDIVTSYCFGSCFNAVDYAGFSHPVAVSMDATLHLCWVFKHIPILRTLTDTCPEWLGLALMPATKGYYDQANQLGAQIDEILDNPQILANSEHDTMYHYFIEHQGQKHGLPGVKREETQQMTKKEKAKMRLWLLHEGLNLRFAGSETVGNACTMAAFYLLRDEVVKKKLVDELVRAWPDVDESLGYEELEKLPYLVCVTVLFFLLQSANLYADCCYQRSATVVLGHRYPHASSRWTYRWRCRWCCCPAWSESHPFLLEHVFSGNSFFFISCSFISSFYGPFFTWVISN